LKEISEISENEKRKTYKKNFTDNLRQVLIFSPLFPLTLPRPREVGYFPKFEKVLEFEEKKNLLCKAVLTQQKYYTEMI